MAMRFENQQMLFWVRFRVYELNCGEIPEGLFF